MQRVIIYDSADCCGKSNMALELSRRTGIPYFKNHGEWDAFEKDNNYFVDCMRFGDYGFFAQYLKQTGASVILDRSWPSEWVYSKAFGRKTNAAVLEQLDEIYSSMDARIIIPYRSDYSNVRDQFASITPTKLREIEALYMKFRDWTRCKTLVMNVDAEDIEQEMNLTLPFVYGVR